MSLAFGGDADVAVAALDDVLADGESEAGTLHEVVQLDESLEDARLLVLGDAGASVEAVEGQSFGLSAAVELHAALPMVTHLDETLMSVFDGVGDEIGEHLLHTALVEHGGACGVGVVLDELHARLLHALGERLADVVEDGRDVALGGLDGQCLTHGRGFEDVVDESHEHVAVVADDADELHTLLLGVDDGQQV